MLLLKNILFTLLIPGTVSVYVPLWLARTVTGGQHWWNWPGVLILGIGTGILLRCVWNFGKRGQGTPFPPDPPKKLVSGSFYSSTRNPMYIGVLAMILGWAIWFGSGSVALYGVAVFLVFHLFVVFYEEPALSKQFGDQYREYCQKVPRWF